MLFDVDQSALSSYHEVPIGGVEMIVCRIRQSISKQSHSMRSKSIEKMHGPATLPFPVLLLPRRVKLAATNICVKISFIIVFRSVRDPANQKQPTRHLVI